MARTSDTIYNFLEDSLVALAATIGIVIVPSTWRRTDYKRMILQIVAIAQAFQEQLYDSFTQDIELIASSSAPQTRAWFQDKMINLFEYNATTVPIVQFDTDTLTPYYTNPNSSNRIIKYCSVTPTAFGVTLIKVAEESGGLPSQVSATPLSAAQTFVQIIGVPGIIYNVVSEPADRIFMQLDVYFNGLYSAIIESNVISAINSYLAYISTVQFDGTFSLTDLEIAVMSVTGVNDIVPINVQARGNLTTVGTGTNLVLNKLEQSRNWDTIAGYMIAEDTATDTKWRLTDFRNGVSGIKNLNLIAE